MLGYFTCYGSVSIASSLSWRTPFVVQAIVGFLLATGCMFLPDSPRWLLQNGRREDALKALERLGIERAEAEKDILAPQQPNTTSTSSVKGFLDIFNKEYRGRTMLGLFILGILQLSGIDGVLYVSLSQLKDK